MCRRESAVPTPSESKLASRRSKKRSAKQRLSAKPRPKPKRKREFKQKQRLAQEKLSWLNSERLRKLLAGQQQSALAKLKKRAEQQMSAAKPQSLSSNVRLRSVLAK
jgi:hypothetical protein